MRKKITETNQQKLTSDTTQNRWKMMEFDTEELILVISSSSFFSASHTGDLLLQSFRRMSSHLLSSIIRYQLVRCLIPPFFWTGCFDGSFPVGRITDVQEREPCATSNYPDFNPCCRYFWPVDIRLVENVLALCQSPFPLAADVLPNESRVWTPFHLIQTYFLVQLKIASDQAALAFWTYRGIWGRLDRGDPPSTCPHDQIRQAQCRGRLMIVYS